MSLSIRQLGKTFVAEVRGIDLRHMPSQKVFDELYDAFLKYRILVIPGQALSIDQHLAFGRLFGELHQVPAPKDVKTRINNPEVDDVSNLNRDGDLAGANSEKVMFALGNQLWHSDLSFCANSAHSSMLHAVEIAEEGGETQFCDLVAAYKSLDDATKQRIEGVIAEHSLAHSRIRGGHTGVDLEMILKFRPPALQPLVRTHPENGEKVLFIGAHVARVLGLDPQESDALVEKLLAHVDSDDFIYTHRWAVNDLVIWDNRQTLHRGRPYDADNVRRVMHRVTIVGDGPNVVEGKIVEPEVKRRDLRVPA